MQEDDVTRMVAPLPSVWVYSFPFPAWWRLDADDGWSKEREVGDEGGNASDLSSVYLVNNVVITRLWLDYVYIYLKMK